MIDTFIFNELSCCAGDSLVDFRQVTETLSQSATVRSDRLESVVQSETEERFIEKLCSALTSGVRELPSWFKVATSVGLIPIRNGDGHRAG